MLLAKDGETHRVEAHPGAGVLVAASDGARFVTGGDDGRVAVTGPDGSTATLARPEGRLDRLARRERVRRLRLRGRQAGDRPQTTRAGRRSLEVPSTARGLAFAPKGYRLAIAHYNGATLWFPNLEAKPEVLDWKGSHLDVTWSPDGRFVVTSMQENALHGWRLLPDKGHMRMSGYPSKTRSFAWSHDGKWLATSGRRGGDRLALRIQGGPDGQGAAGMRRAARQGGTASRSIPTPSCSRSATRTAASSSSA